MALEILTADTPRTLRQFVDLPWRLHDRERFPQWVPPLRLAVRDALDRKGNPFYERAERELFMAVRDGRLVGRIAAIENRAHNEFHADRIGFFGFFECANDPAASLALVNRAAEWLAVRGLGSMRGPVSPSTNHECGILVDGFEHRPAFLTPWNPPYYESLVTAAGLRPAMDLLGYAVPIGEPGFALPDSYAALASRVGSDHGVVFRDVDLGRFDREVDLCWEVYNSAWEPNWGFVPMSRAEFEHMARDMKHIIWPEVVCIAEVDGTPAGFMLALPDINVILQRIGTGRLFPTGWLRLLLGARRLQSGRILALGIRKEFRSRALFALFVSEVIRRGQARGIRTAEASWILEDNVAMRRPLERMGARVDRRWRMYEMPLPERS